MKVLVPLDGSQAGEAALPWAVLLAQTRGQSLVLTQAIPWPVIASDGMMSGYVPPDVYDDMMAAEKEVAEEYLAGIRARLAEQGTEAEVIVRHGSPYVVLLNLADELGVDAIVMATHGRGGLRRTVLGSVANAVVQHALTPVLLVREDGMTPAAPPAFDRILVPLDGSSLAERALDSATGIARPGSLLVLVRAEPAGQAPHPGTNENAPALYLGAMAETLKSKGLRVETDVRQGRPAEEILEAARSHESDVIVMGTHGRSGPARWLLGSVADEVVRHADRPVLLVSVRAAVARSAEPYTVGDLLSGESVAVGEDESLDVVLRKMLRQRATGASVLNTRGDLVGIVSERDLTDWHDRVVDELAHEEAPAPSEYARRLQTTTAAGIMTRPTPAMDVSTPLARATHLFRERGVARLPVTRDGKLVGVLTRTDILKAMAARFEAEAGVENPSD